uniref:L-type lectin-like domain-containing protein n=1 Tax=Paramoeba aestuarina TaxID=180227 RepID=A0A7S4PI86_9EUKA|mmetsp:Transcript_679/g.1157  ORF Transcript_679/g.1157 Transcript_679/m.1157 type:complete len:412 (+) Transcript_679:108-1343(+)
MLSKWASLVLVVLLVGVVVGKSDEFGQNPQHDFGSVERENMNPILPFWTMLGDAFANEDFVRLTPDRQSKTGAVWNTQQLLWDSWEIMIKLNVNGVSQVGADGLAFWLAKEVNVLGGFFGFIEKFSGIGVVIDTYDNDGSGQHPIVTLFQNDGTKTYEHSHHGGEHHASEMELGHCSYALRNQKDNTIMRIKYENRRVTVDLRAEGSSEWFECVSVGNVHIDVGLYLGLSAATGHLADNHDIHGITVRNLEDDAKYFDSESKYAQFSKYTVAESLGRIQADIRGAMFSETNQPTKRNNAASSSSDLSRELSALKQEIASVSQALRESSPPSPAYAARDRARDRDGDDGEGQVRDLVAPFEEKLRDLKGISNELTKNVGGVSTENRKLQKMQNKLDRLINSVESSANQKKNY